MQLQDIVSPCQSALEEVDESSCNAERVSETIVPAQIARYQPHSPSAKPLSGASAAPVLYLGTRPPSSQAPPWNRRITSEIAHLSSMHSVASWVPGEHQIRPTSAILEQKAAQLTSMEPLYETLADYVWETVFGFCTGTCAKGKRKALVPHVQDTGQYSIIYLVAQQYTFYSGLTVSVLFVMQGSQCGSESLPRTSFLTTSRAARTTGSYGNSSNYPLSW